MPRTLALLCALALIASLACDDGDDAAPDTAPDTEGEPMRRGGNSGSEGVLPGVQTDAADEDSGGGNAVPCPCNAPGTFTRATVLAQDAEMLQLRIEEVLHGALELSAGDELQARFAGRMPCYRGVVEVAVGDELLAVLSEGEMVDAGRFAGVRVTPWAQQLVMADDGEQQLSIPADALDELWDNPRCHEDHGDWSELDLDSPDGDSDQYWCVNDGDEQQCGGPGPRSCDEPECVETPACEDDDGCPSDMSCETLSRRVCPDDVDFACMEGESDGECADRSAALEAERCEQAERKQCVPFWQLGCGDERACPDGFECVQSSCAPIDPDCEQDADCPGRWLCRTIDGGYCEAGEDCVQGQLQLRTCVPPATASTQVDPGQLDSDAG